MALLLKCDQINLSKSYHDSNAAILLRESLIFHTLLEMGWGRLIFHTLFEMWRVCAGGGVFRKKNLKNGVGADSAPCLTPERMVAERNGWSQKDEINGKRKLSTRRILGTPRHFA